MTTNLELEKTLWAAADKLRSNMDAAEYKHVVLGLIFLKYISDAFEEHYAKLKAEEAETGADPEDKDEYTADRVFTFHHLQDGLGCKGEQKSLLLEKTLTMRWMPSKRIIHL
jgi:type I restriction-modification system DNA methylase subunit